MIVPLQVTSHCGMWKTDVEILSYKVTLFQCVINSISCTYVLFPAHSEEVHAVLFSPGKVYVL